MLLSNFKVKEVLAYLNVCLSVPECLVKIGTCCHETLFVDDFKHNMVVIIPSWFGWSRYSPGKARTEGQCED